MCRETFGLLLFKVILVLMYTLKMNDKNFESKSQTSNA